MLNYIAIADCSSHQVVSAWNIGSILQDDQPFPSISTYAIALWLWLPLL